MEENKNSCCCCSDQLTGDIDELRKYSEAEKQRADALENELAVVKQDRDDSKQMVLSLVAMALKIVELGEDKTLQDAKEIISADMKQLSESCFRSMHPEEGLFAGVVSKIEHN